MNVLVVGNDSKRCKGMRQILVRAGVSDDVEMATQGDLIEAMSKKRYRVVVFSYSDGLADVFDRILTEFDRGLDGTDPIAEQVVYAVVTWDNKHDCGVRELQDMTGLCIVNLGPQIWKSPSELKRCLEYREASIGKDIRLPRDGERRRI